jgi:hypothetical protein
MPIPALLSPRAPPPAWEDDRPPVAGSQGRLGPGRSDDPPSALNGLNRVLSIDDREPLCLYIIEMDIV